MKIILAVDSFKGCLSSQEANNAAAEGVYSVCPDAKVVQIPVSDGGEGFLEAFHAAVGGEMIEVKVKDPLMRPVTAEFLLKGDTAVIEMAQASGLNLLKEEERNPLSATSYGTGELVAHAIRKGVKHIIIGLGGSATSDAGIGMLSALVDAFANHGVWNDIDVFKDVTFTVASDVKNPLYGENGAACVFAPQKGATPEMVLRLDERARRFADISARHFGYDYSMREGAGAAGGSRDAYRALIITGIYGYEFCTPVSVGAVFHKSHGVAGCFRSRAPCRVGRCACLRSHSDPRKRDCPGLRLDPGTACSNGSAGYLRNSIARLVHAAGSSRYASPFHLKSG